MKNNLILEKNSRIFEIEDLGTKIKYLREAKNLAPKDVANELQVSVTVLLAWENNQVIPPYKVLMKIAIYFEVPIDALYQKKSKSTISEIIGNNIKFLRNSRGMTATRLANELNVTQTTVSHWETGSKLPRMSSLNQIAKYFNVSADDLMIPIAGFGNEIPMTHDDLSAKSMSMVKSVSTITEISLETIFIKKDISVTFYGQDLNEKQKRLIFQLAKVVIEND